MRKIVLNPLQQLPLLKNDSIHSQSRDGLNMTQSKLYILDKSIDNLNVRSVDKIDAHSPGLHPNLTTQRSIARSTTKMNPLQVGNSYQNELQKIQSAFSIKLNELGSPLR